MPRVDINWDAVMPAGHDPHPAILLAALFRTGYDYPEGLTLHGYTAPDEGGDIGRLHLTSNMHGRTSVALDHRFPFGSDERVSWRMVEGLIASNQPANRNFLYDPVAAIIIEAGDLYHQPVLQMIFLRSHRGHPIGTAPLLVTKSSYLADIVLDDRHPDVPFRNRAARLDWGAPLDHTNPGWGYYQQRADEQRRLHVAPPEAPQVAVPIASEVLAAVRGGHGPRELPYVPNDHDDEEFDYDEGDEPF